VKPPKRGSTSPLKAVRGSSSDSTPGAGAIYTVWHGSGRSRSWSRSRSPPKQQARVSRLSTISRSEAIEPSVQPSPQRECPRAKSPKGPRRRRVQQLPVPVACSVAAAGRKRTKPPYCAASHLRGADDDAATAR
jgi:hypothetical protein